MSQSDYDVAIVGASIAGCTAAIFYGRRGLKVALIERNQDAAAYKKVCTHYIQRSATPTIQRLGIDRAIEDAGGIRNAVELWTRWGWIRGPRDQSAEHMPHGYNIRREKLDPILRRLAAETPGVDLLLGETARDLVSDDDRITGILVEGRDGQSRSIDARLVVGADGRHSRIAELAELPTKITPNNRFAYFAYFRNVSLSSGTRSQMWSLEPDIAYTFPNDDGLTILACMPAKEKLPAFKSDVQGSFIRFFDTLPEAPDISGAEQVSGMLGMLDMPNISRPAARPGLALIGDAAMASDPLWGVGCGFALQSAEWLVESTAESLILQDDAAVDRGLKRYRKTHHARLGGHHKLMSDFATGRPYSMIERLFYSASTRDPVTARHFEDFGSRSIGVREFLAPQAVARAAWVNLSHRRRHREPTVTAKMA